MSEAEEKFDERKPRKRSMTFFGVFVFLWVVFFGFFVIQEGDELSVKNFDFTKQEVLGEKTQMEDDPVVLAQATDEEVEKNEVIEVGDQGQGNIESKDVLKSESFSVDQVRFGTAVALDSGSLGSVPLELSSISSEVLVSGEDQEPRFLVAWKTNKDAMCEVAYSRGDGDDVEYFKEENYGFDHSVLLSDIELSTIYAYNIKAKDRWGNQVVSEYYSVYTGDKKESIFDLIISAIENTFGWAMKK